MRWWVLVVLAPPAALMVYMTIMHANGVYKNWGKHPSLDWISFASVAWMYMVLFALGFVAYMAATI